MYLREQERVRFLKTLSLSRERDFEQATADSTENATPLYALCVAVCCSVLQCVAVCRSVLQCVTVCCSVLQCWGATPL